MDINQSIEKKFFSIFSSFFIFSYIYHISEKGENLYLFFFHVIICFLTYYCKDNVRKLVFFIYLVFIIGFNGFWFPNLANHSVLLLFLCIYLLFKLVKSYLNNNLEIKLYENKKYLGLFLVWVYFIAGFHKLNTDFIEPVSSCANWFHQKLSVYLDMEISVPQIIEVLSPYFALFIELVGAILLLVFPMIGVMCFISLHLYLGLGGFADFSALAIAVLLVFLPEKKIVEVYEHRLNRLFLFCALLSAAITYLHVHQLLFDNLKFLFIRFLQGVFLCISTIPLLFIILKKPKELLSKRNYKFTKLWPVNGLFLLVLIFYSINPYLGLNTAGTFTMFSNLRTEDNKSNHLIVPNVQLFSFQKEIISVIEVDPSYLGEYFEIGKLMPFTHFRILFESYLRNEDDFVNITVKSVNGISSIGGDSFDKNRWLDLNFFQKKYLNFRAINKFDSINHCRW